DGNLMYQSNYQAGLRILDITDPENPVEVAAFDTAPFADNVKGFAGSWSNYPYFKSGVIVVSSQAEGVFMLKKQEQDL
ncbi:MAG: regulator, partial [Rhodothermales bacterium]